MCAAEGVGRNKLWKLDFSLSLSSDDDETIICTSCYYIAVAIVTFCLLKKKHSLCFTFIYSIINKYTFLQAHYWRHLFPCSVDAVSFFPYITHSLGWVIVAFARTACLITE